MKIEINNMEDAQEMVKLIGLVVGAGSSLYLLVKRVISDSQNLDINDKNALLAELESMKLPEWKDL